jgi:hypothetical protein
MGLTISNSIAIMAIAVCSTIKASLMLLSFCIFAEQGEVSLGATASSRSSSTVSPQAKHHVVLFSRTSVLLAPGLGVLSLDSPQGLNPELR